MARMAITASSLPLELLTIIFTFLHTRKRKNWRERRSPPLDVVAPSQVCHRWRVASLGAQHLWSGWLPLLSSDWTHICLTRCRSIPFDVLWDYPLISSNLEYRLAAHLVYPHMKRVGALIMPLRVLPEFNPVPMLIELRTGLSLVPAPNLTNLVIVLSGAHPAAPGSDPGDMFPLEKCIGSPTTFNLLELSLTRMAINLVDSRGLFSANLRSLSLINCHLWNDVDEMIETLQVVPMLEFFQHRLEEPFRSQEGMFTPSRSTKHPLRCVQLPHLRLLHLSGDSTFTINITMFSYLAFPSNATLRLKESVRSDPVLLEDIEIFIQMGREAFKEHFALAITHGECFDALAVEDQVVVVAPALTDESLSFAETKIFSAPMCHLSDDFELNVLEIEGEEVPADSRPGHDLLMDMVLRLPIFSGVKRLTLRGNFETYTVPFFQYFQNITTLVIDAGDNIFCWDLLTGLLRELQMEDPDLELLRRIKRIIGPYPPAHELYGDSLVELFLGQLADAALAYWGDDLEVFGLSGFVHDRDEGDGISSMLGEKLGYHRIRCWSMVEDEDGQGMVSDEDSSGDDSDGFEDGDW
ncbi:hypothetical protein PENSPDRAFT_307951 [Peniophora sp. CONT]|nr:hypothetical protein PENSPDRAFT_307951 [Peniophora sp. CONT]